MAKADSIRQEAQAELAKEQAEKAKAGLKALYRRKADAEAVVRGIDRDIEVALAKIDAGELP